MSVKLHYIDSHLDEFPTNCGKNSEEKGERFHQDILICEEKISEKFSPKIADRIRYNGIHNPIFLFQTLQS